jgi:hypothetical protein
MMAEQRRRADAGDDRTPLTWRGKDLKPEVVIDLWREGASGLKSRTKRIEDTRAFRRKERSSLVKVDRTWARLNPDAAALAQLTLPQRLTLERDLIARVGSSEPSFEREPLGFRERDIEGAEACAAYMNEWRLRSVPFGTFAGKSVEDSEFARVTLPCDLDMDGAPDYFDYISDRAYDERDEDERKAFSRDEDDRRKRYVKRDADGERVVREPYQATAGADNRELDKDAAEARKRHEDDVTAYILRCGLDASTTRVIPALDCVPIFRRGTRRDRWELAALVERVLYHSWELLEHDYGWVNMGDRLATPIAARSEGASTSLSESGQAGQFYLYTAYLISTDDEGTDHPLVVYTVGGAGTWDSRSGTKDDPSSVAVIDLYDEYGIEGPLWSYHFGLHTEDDDVDHYGQPYLWALLDLLKAIESMQGATRAAIALNAFTGYLHTPDAGLPDEAYLESDSTLRVPNIPGPGQIETAAGSVEPFRQAQVGADAWRLAEMDRLALQEATAIDTVPGGSGPSGHALLVQQTLGTIAKRQNRECVLAATIASGEAHLRILAGIAETYGIRWPIRTTQERPVKGEPREGRAPAMFDPDWVADGQFHLAADFPSEANLAMVDLEASLADRGYSSFDNVQKEKGQPDPQTEWKKVLKDRLRKTPAYLMRAEMQLAQQTGDQEMEALLKSLQEQGKMTRAGVPGAAPNGVPTSALDRGTAGPPVAGGGQTPIASSVRGGIMQAEQGGAAMQQRALAASANGSLGGT